ncbi:unnamed protein product [Calypogeia fissa]
MAYTLDQYVQVHTQPQQPVQAFEHPYGNEKMLQINFGVPSSGGPPLNMVWIKHNSMVAHRGEVGFRREGILEHGVGNMFKKAVTSEGMSLTQATANTRAQLFLADYGKEVTIFRLQGDSISVNGNDLLAFEPSVSHKIKMLKKVSSMLAGGLFNVKLSGHGFVAILTHGKPVTLTVEQGKPPVYTDPDATVAWSGELSPDFKTDIQFKTMVGRGSGESFQMKFDGSHGHSGFVLVQPYEEHESS